MLSTHVYPVKTSLGILTNQASLREPMHKSRTMVLILAVAAFGAGPRASRSQSPSSAPASIPAPEVPAASPSTPQPAGDTTEKQAANQADSLAQTVPTASAKTFTVPAGTKVLLQLRSAINTKSAKPGDAIYLASTFPVVVGTRVVIPSGVYVQGIVDNVIRAGRVKGRAQLNLHFTSIIFPNGTVAEIPGIINSLPGTSKRTVDSEGKVTQDSSKGHDVAEAAKIGLEGAGIGSIGGAATGHPLEGAAIGGLGGVAVGAVVALFTRGADISIETGTPVEMVLQRPLLLESTNLSATAADAGGAASSWGAAPGQPRALDKPTGPRARVICPPGGLGCS